MSAAPLVALEGLDPSSAAFLVRCLSHRCGGATMEELRATAAATPIDWPALARHAQAHRLAPLLYTILKRADFVPAETIEVLRRAYQGTSMRNLLMLHECNNALRQLAAAGIPVLALKGAALGVAVYGNMAVRPLGDIDVLVHRGDVPRVLAALATIGFAEWRAEIQAGATQAYENEMLLLKKGVIDVFFEVHWSLFDSPHHQDRIAMDWFWSTAQAAMVGNSEALVLGPEAELLHLCGHLCLHHSGEELLWLHDIAELLARHADRFDWNLVLDRAQAFDLVLPLQKVLPRVADTWGAPFPLSARERLTALRPSADESRVYQWLTAHDRPVAHRFWTDLASMRSWRLRLNYIWTHLLPSPAYMRARYGIRNAAMLPLYYPYRWWLGIASALGRRGAGPRQAP